MRLSISSKLALVFFAITFVAIVGLYMYIGAGLQRRLVDQKLTELAAAARVDSTRIAQTVGGSIPEPAVRARVGTAAALSGARVTLLSVVEAPGGPQIDNE